MGTIERIFGSLWTPLLGLLRALLDQLRNPQLWGVLLLVILFISSLELIEGYVSGPWPHQRRGDDRYNRMALGSRSAWLAVVILLLPGLLLAVVNAVVRIVRQVPTGSAAVGSVQVGGLPTDTMHWMGLGLVLLAWIVFVAGSRNVMGFGHYLRRVGLITPAALLVCLLLGDLMLLLALVDVAR